MLVNLEFPKPDLSDRIVLLTEILEVCKSRIVSENKRSCGINMPIIISGDTSPRPHLTDEEVGALRGFLLRNGWRSTITPSKGGTSYNISLSCYEDHASKVLQEALKKVG